MEFLSHLDCILRMLVESEHLFLELVSNLEFYDDEIAYTKHLPISPELTLIEANAFLLLVTKRKSFPAADLPSWTWFGHPICLALLKWNLSNQSFICEGTLLYRVLYIGKYALCKFSYNEKYLSK